MRWWIIACTDECPISVMMPLAALRPASTEAAQISTSTMMRLDVGSAGYQSPSQFSREYSRLYGRPPLRDVAVSRHAGSDDWLNALLPAFAAT
ncbi:hypothetical protein BPNPMPFG_002128 [Mesorhizobium sp. AR07]|uniref:hypothetical protein n=1 Tax=Mesorhizobium sp. AR07 TaxID=2865838 RepID=UPI00215EAB4B|nr:hypothetical protein [Mesorhizobium sp. AR07]UVK48013.1 hypothetical protein BPNPMPFG_002128 [Mesorhizobium sp. AR07]